MSLELYVISKLEMTMRRKSKDWEGSEVSENGKRPLEVAEEVPSGTKPRPDTETLPGFCN